jgi:uncharacterized protein
MRVFLLLLILLLSGTSSAHATLPSFDCAKAQGAAQLLVCKDDELAALENETARLFKLARDGPSLANDESRKAELIATERGWIKGRDECWKADNLRACVASSYVIRIHELRQGYADARSQDDTGITLGPKAVRCSGFEALFTVTFVNSDPGFAYIGWEDKVHVLTHVLSGSGAKYEGRSEEGAVLFWNKGDGAIVEIPERSMPECRMEDIG